MEHTKGPWIAKLNSDECWVVMAGSIVIATLHRKDWPEWNEANARLIAAAPNLLNASDWQTVFTSLWNERARWTKRKDSINRTDSIRKLTIAIDKVRALF